TDALGRLHSFPTRRSSDLHVSNIQAWVKLNNARDGGSQGNWGVCDGTRAWDGNLALSGQGGYPCLDQIGRGKSSGLPPLYQPQRSEEHTSELQSRSDLVCR